MKRRNFVKSAISFSVLLAFHNQAQALSKLTGNTKKLKPGIARFPKVTLYTSKIKEQYHFYAKTLGFPILKHDKTSFSVKTGDSILEFKETLDGSNPFYHYAINIPSNKYKKAKKWLEKRTPLLMSNNNNNGLFYFDFWDAHAMYFKDPAGNIGELIARHTLDNDRDGEFDVSDLLCVSEIGTPVESPSNLRKELKTAYNLDTLGSSMFIGDENGLFVAVPIDRLWFPDYTQKAKVFPTEIIISDKGKDEFVYKNYPYKIKRKK